jgi:hypothetical protein
MRHTSAHRHLLTASVAVVLASSMTVASAGAPPMASSPRFPYTLESVSILSPTDAWAVGGLAFNGDEGFAGILHWDGVSWAQVDTPNPGVENELDAITALSDTDVWAAGKTRPEDGRPQTFMIHWNGSVWTRVASPNVSDAYNGLNSISAESAKDIWAGGYADEGFDGKVETLLIHWNGKKWTRASSPSPDMEANEISSVLTLSKTDAWAVGNVGFATNTLILHWDGTSWSQIPSPDPAGPASRLNSVSGVSSTDLWAVGWYEKESRKRGPSWHTLTMHWNGTNWSRVKSPSPKGDRAYDRLTGVSAVAGDEVWAVGDSTAKSANGEEATLILRWNGSRWKQVASPNPGGTYDNALEGVDAVSASEAWAVGRYTSGSLLLHWDGSAWSQG